MICSVCISAFKRKNSFTVIPVHHRVACAGLKPHCCALTWRDSSFPIQRHGAKPVLLKEREGWSTGPSCCIVSSSSGVKNPWFAVNLSSVLTLCLTGTLLTAFKLQPDFLRIVTFWWVLCKDGSEGPAWAHPSCKVCILLLQNLMAQCETWGELSHSEPELFYFLVAQHL